MKVAPRARVGCSGWNYASWRREVYAGAPPSRWLGLYAQLFDTVEVNATFYRLPTEKAVQAWVDATPADFCFSVKASRYLTHVKRLKDLGKGLKRFYEPLHPLIRSGKLGPILWQLPQRSTATTTDWRRRSKRCRPESTLSNSDTRAGTPTRCTRF